MRTQLCIALLVVLGPTALGAQSPDSAIVRIEKRLTAGDRAGARLIAESLLVVTPSGSPAFAAALYWRAATAANAADAERDYLRVSVEYPLSPRAPDALLSLAQLEYARRDRAAARRHFEQILREYPTGPMVAKASYWTARLAFDDGDPSRACAALATAKSTVSREDIELANQIEYYAARCLTASSDSAVSDSAAARDSTERTRPRQEFSVQIASFTRKQDAETMAARLARQGLESRVSGTSAPYRVRVGRYATRDEAARMLARVRRGNPRAIIVEAEPR